jgi:hypothetical protein
MNPTPDYLRLGPPWVCRQIPMSRPPRPPAYRVGERFRPNRNSWPVTTEYSFGSSGHELTLFRPRITASLIDDVGKGPAEFALIVEAPVILFAYRFGDSVPWGDTLYCWHLQPESRRVVPSWEPRCEFRTLLWVTLVGSDDGIIHAQRGLTLSPAFSGSLHDAIRSQAMRTFDPSLCTIAIGSLLAETGSVEQRLHRAAVRTVGNS